VTVGRHVYPKKGNGYKAIQFLMKDPSVLARKVAKDNISLNTLKPLK
jgi:hypothetical protein